MNFGFCGRVSGILEKNRSGLTRGPNPIPNFHSKLLDCTSFNYENMSNVNNKKNLILSPRRSAPLKLRDSFTLRDDLTPKMAVSIS